MTTFSSPIRNGTGNFYLELRQESQSIGSNTSTVYYNLYIKGVGSYGFWNKFNSGKTDIYINGSRVHYQTGRNFDLRGGGTQNLASGRTTVKHNEDGTKSFKFSASLWSSSATGSLSGNFTLSKIPRASSFYIANAGGAKVTSIDVGSDIKFVIDKKATSFTHTINYVINNSSSNIYSESSSSSLNWNIPYSFLYSYMTNRASLNVDFCLDTYDGSTKIGSDRKVLTIKVPSSAKPMINSVDFSEANKNKLNIIGESPFYQNLTDLRVKTNASGQYGASINSVVVRLDNSYKEGSDVIFDGPNVVGQYNVEVEVKDSRGLSSKTIKGLVFSQYKLPNISFFNAFRDSSNTKVGKARLSLESTVIDNKNPLSVVVEIADKGSSSFKTAYSATVGNGKFNDVITLSAGLDDFKAYDVRARISDKFKSHMALSVIPATSQSLVIGASKPVVGIGKVPEIDKGLEVDGIIKVSGDDQKTLSLNGSKSQGALIEWRIDGVRSNWICSWGSHLNFGGDVDFRNTMSVKDKIVPYNSSQNQVYEVVKNDIDGYIRCTKDILGFVHIWGKVTLKGSYPTGRWNVWGKIPQSWAPKVMTPIVTQNGGKVICGVCVSAKGDILWIGQEGNSYSPSVGDAFEMDCVFRAGDSDW